MIKAKELLEEIERLENENADLKEANEHLRKGYNLAVTLCEPKEGEEEEENIAPYKAIAFIAFVVLQIIIISVMVNK